VPGGSFDHLDFASHFDFHKMSVRALPRANVIRVAPTASKKMQNENDMMPSGPSASQGEGGAHIFRSLFEDFAPSLTHQTELRRRITAAYRQPEPECVPLLVEAATLPGPARAQAKETATLLVKSLRSKQADAGIQNLIHEYSLSSQEGIALMCLAEALLRIPDAATRDVLIRDKLGHGDWYSHLGGDRSLFVNAATWGLIVAGKLTTRTADGGLAVALAGLLARCGGPVVRAAIDVAMQVLSKHFIAGQTIDEAIGNGCKMEARGFRYSYDMLGEAAVTASDAQQYFQNYERAIGAIGAASNGRGVVAGPGISIKLSALHPRFVRSQTPRIAAELFPRLKRLAVLAKRFDIGLNIDAEESDRVDLSLDLLTMLANDAELTEWDGLGFVVQAYGKRCPSIIDFIVDLARRQNRRVMVRLVKGAYWDTEIKRAQVDGLTGYPVYTRKVYSDVAYVACARKLLAERDAVFPQFATHNAQTVATIHALASAEFKGDFEFQCLHGMGDTLYEHVVDPTKLNRPCRIYAPVGSHNTLLPYLVRRLLENGANNSFVSRVTSRSVSIAELITDPAEQAKSVSPLGAPHAAIPLPKSLYGDVRQNSRGLDLSDEAELSDLATALRNSVATEWFASPSICLTAREWTPVVNPADHRDRVGNVLAASSEEIEATIQASAVAVTLWSAVPVDERAACLLRAADLMQGAMHRLVGLLIREAGKSASNAISEVREAIDFLRYYASEAKRMPTADSLPLGPVACISPWNFPLAIFTGQVAAALVAGNSVVAKPAEQTPLVAAQAIKLLHEAGVPKDVLQLLPGDGQVGAAVVAHPRICGVLFTGSNEVARLIQRVIALRFLPTGEPVPLVAETGGQNAMIADSSALAEQAVGDAIYSAFDSAGQRCSALRVLCLQDDMAEHIISMLKGAMQELTVGRPDRLAVDVGPVIDAAAKETIERYVAAMARAGRRVSRLALPPECESGTFAAPTIIEIESISDLKEEVFGPVLHVLRYQREDLARLFDDINATGYGLTFGLHTRIEEVTELAERRVHAGNIYVNRNMVGAVVGVQPFGGGGLSGTGPKAGGPLYLRRLLAHPPLSENVYRPGRAAPPPPPPFAAFVDWLDKRGHSRAADRCRALAQRSRLGARVQLDGPVGESNSYALHRRGRVLLLPLTIDGFFEQLGATFATGNEAVLDPSCCPELVLDHLPSEVSVRLSVDLNWDATIDLAIALIEGEGDRVRGLCLRLAAMDGTIVTASSRSTGSLLSNDDGYDLDLLLGERSVSVNSTAVGGNVALLSLE
jgi:RHH-type proline utilization regulon transcriptional repressor/proline dehydrogenase/delta 1-pyrroline-5-carboxylate dehydrogenase